MNPRNITSKHRIKRPNELLDDKDLKITVAFESQFQYIPESES